MTDFDAMFIPQEIRGIDYGGDTDIDGIPSSFSELYAKDIQADLDANMIDLEIQKSEHNRGPDASLLGPKQGKISFKIPWRGGKTAAAAAGTSPVSTLAQLCGLQRTALPGGSGTITGGGASTVTALDAAFASYASGHFILVGANDGADLQLRPITRKVSAAGTTTLTVSPPWSTQPVNGDTFYPIDVLTPLCGPSGDAYAGFNVYLGGDATYCHQLQALGCRGSMKLESVKTGEIPWALFEFLVNTWTNEGRVNRANAADAFADPVCFKSDLFYLDTEVIDIESLEFDPGILCSEMPGQNPQSGTVAGEGRTGWFHGNSKPVIGFNPYYDDQYFEDWLAGTERSVFAQSILDSKQVWGLRVGAVQFTKVGQGSIGDGLVGAALTSKITDPGLDADENNIPLYALCFSGSGS